MSYAVINLERKEGNFFGSLYGISTDVGDWFRILAEDQYGDPVKIAIDSHKIMSVLSVFREYQRRRKKPFDIHQDLKSLIVKLLKIQTTPPMIDLSTITPEQLIELKKQIADREAILKKVTEVGHQFETAAKKAGYADLQAALTDLGYVKASEVKAVKKTAAKATGERKARVTVTDELRSKVLDLLDVPKTANVIAQECGISAQTVAAIKKKAGLSKPRKVTATPAA
jgi:hypothetical protein